MLSLLELCGFFTTIFKLFLERLVRDWNIALAYVSSTIYLIIGENLR